MSNNILRAGAAAGTVVLSAGTGLATNLLTDRPSWGVGAAVVVLVIAGGALAVVLSSPERQGSTLPGPGGVVQDAQATGGRIIQAGRDIRTGMSPGIAVLCLLVVAVVAVVALLVLAPAKVNVSPEDLSYQLSASPVDPRTVHVTAKASGQPDPRLIYWFIVEVDYHNGYIQYYPRWRMTGRSADFDVPIPGAADTEFGRVGRAYGLDGTQDRQAEDYLGRQFTGVNDYFEKAPGRPVSRAVDLPY